MIRLIVGLGNPGRQYERTPHNVGFEVVDLLAARHHGSWLFERRFEAETSEIALGSARVTLMKPMTYMNLSGQAVGVFAQKNGIEPGEVLAVSDDVHLPLGQLRIRPSGSHGGQKGLLSIINSLGSLDYPRLRVGMRPEDREVDDRTDFVLSRLRPEERIEIEIAVREAADAIEMMLEKDFTTAMNRFNRKRV